MDKDLARVLIRSMLKASEEVTSTIPTLKEHCEEKEYDLYGKNIAKIAADIGLEVLNRVFLSHPDLKEEVDEHMKKYGKY